MAVGGGVKNELWVQIMSDVTGQPQIIPEVGIGGAYGDAFLAGLATGIVPSVEELDRSWIRPARTIEPNLANAALYDEYFAEYVALYPAIKPSLHRLANLGRAGAGD